MGMRVARIWTWLFYLPGHEFEPDPSQCVYGVRVVACDADQAGVYGQRLGKELCHVDDDVLGIAAVPALCRTGDYRQFAKDHNVALA